MCSRPVAIPTKMPKKGRRTTPKKYKTIVLLGVPTGITEYQAGISKLGGVILRYDIHSKADPDALDTKCYRPCARCAKTRQKNWLPRQLSRYEYQKLDEMQKKLQEDLMQYEMTNDLYEDSRRMKPPPYFKTEYQAAYGP